MLGRLRSIGITTLCSLVLAANAYAINPATGINLNDANTISETLLGHHSYDDVLSIMASIKSYKILGNTLMVTTHDGTLYTESPVIISQAADNPLPKGIEARLEQDKPNIVNEASGSSIMFTYIKDINDLSRWICDNKDKPDFIKSFINHPEILNRIMKDYMNIAIMLDELETVLNLAYLLNDRDTYIKYSSKFGETGESIRLFHWQETYIPQLKELGFVDKAREIALKIIDSSRKVADYRSALELAQAAGLDDLIVQIEEEKLQFDI
jgi:hypothetical protein